MQSVFSCIRTEYGPEITRYLETFHAEFKQKDSVAGISCTFCDIFQIAIPKNTGEQLPLFSIGSSRLKDLRKLNKKIHSKFLLKVSLRGSILFIENAR